MSKDKPPRPPIRPDAAREQRLAQALRQNLRRRKGPPTPAPDDSQPGD